MTTKLTGDERLLSWGSSSADIQVEDVALFAAQQVVVQQVPTFSSVPSNPAGLYLVLADESKNGAPQMYFFNASHRYWIAMVQDA